MPILLLPGISPLLPIGSQQTGTGRQAEKAASRAWWGGRQACLPLPGRQAGNVVVQPG